MIRPRLLPAVLCCAALATAQRRVLIVDPHGGPGVFADIQPAIDAANPGDRIEVRGGSYNGFTVAKGVDIDAVLPADAGIVAVTGVPAGDWCRIDRLTLSLLTVTQCSGRVLLSQLTVTGPSPIVVGPLVTVSGSANVLLRDCVAAIPQAAVPVLPPVDGFVAGNSNLVLERCRVQGSRGYDSQNHHNAGGRGGSGLSATGCHVVAVASTFMGGSGGNGYGEPLFGCSAGGPGGAGVVCDGGVFLGECSLIGGPGGVAFASCAIGAQGPAVVGLNTVTTDCRLLGNDVVRIPPLPTLSVPHEVLRGRIATLTFAGHANSRVLVQCSQVHAFTMVPGLAVPLLLPVQAIPLPLISLDASGAAQLAIPMPLDAALQDQFVFFQALVLNSQSPTPTLTNLGDLRLR